MNISKKLSITNNIIYYILLSLCSLFIILYSYSSILRFIYPYSIMNVEDASLQVLNNILRTGIIYTTPTLNYISLVYTPIYYYISSALSFVVGPGYISMRLLSLLSSLGIMFFIFLFVYSETRNRFYAFISMSLFVFTYPLTSWWIDLSKPDTLMMLIVLAAYYLIRFKNSYLSFIISGILLALAYFTKQQAISISIILILYVVATNYKKGLVLISATIISMVTTYIIADGITHGWFSYYTLILPTKITLTTIVPKKIFDFFITDIICQFPIAIAIILIYFFAADGRKLKNPMYFYLALFTSTIVGIMPTRFIEGGSFNALIPLYTVISLLFGIGLSKIIIADEKREPYYYILNILLIYILCLIQFIMHIYNPFLSIPTEDQKRTKENAVKIIRGIDGEVFIADFGQLPTMAGKSGTAHMGTITDILVGDTGEVKENLKKQLTDAFQNKFYAALFLKPDWMEQNKNNEVWKEIDYNYVKKESNKEIGYDIYVPNNK